MKRLFSLIVLLAVFTGCSDEISKPTPGFQAFKDGNIWRAEDFKAYIYLDGHVRIVGSNGYETVELNLVDSEEGMYYTASTEDNSAGLTTPFNSETLQYLTYDVNGPIPSINNPVLTAGSGYTQSFSVATSTSGDGTGMRVDTTVDDGGRVKAVTISQPGVNYAPGDIITVSGGNNNAKFKILSAIEITSFDEFGLSGNFRFTARNTYPDHPFANELVSFENGAFYRIPIILVE